MEDRSYVADGERSLKSLEMRVETVALCPVTEYRLYRCAVERRLAVWDDIDIDCV